MNNMERGEGSPGEPDFMSRWVALGLEMEFPYLEPNSKLGELAVRTFEDHQNSIRSEIEPFDPEKDYREVARRHRVADRKAEIFRRIIHQVRSSLGKRQRGKGIADETYINMIHGAYSLQAMRVRHNIGFTDAEKQELEEFALTVGALCWSEDCHFKSPPA